MKATKKIILICVFLLTLLSIAVVTKGFFGFNEVCDRCGLQRSTQKFFWIPIREINENRLSNYMLNEILPKDHEHKWQFATGGGPWVYCAIGQGKHLYKLVHNEDVVPFLQLVENHEGKKAVSRYVDTLFSEYKKGSSLISALFSECKGEEDYFRCKHDLELILKQIKQ